MTTGEAPQREVARLEEHVERHVLGGEQVEDGHVLAAEVGAAAVRQVEVRVLARRDGAQARARAPLLGEDPAEARVCRHPARRIDVVGVAACEIRPLLKLLERRARAQRGASSCVRKKGSTRG